MKRFKFPLPRGLFAQIFGWFLGAQLLIALALYLLAAATQRGFDERFSEMAGTNLAARAQAAAIAYENGGQDAVREAWRARPDFGARGPSPDNLGSPRRRDNDMQGSALFLLNSKNQATLLAGWPLPAHSFSAPVAINGQNTIWKFQNQNFLLRRVDTAHAHYLATMLLRDGRRGGSGPRLLDGWLGGGPNGPSWPRFLVILAIMGALCFGLARHLTNPVIQLRRATQNFAAGDFGVRVAPALGARRDELGDLGADFDAMAARIENLLRAQRQLLGDISHELRSPLTRLCLALELAQSSAGAPALPFLGRIEDETRELNGLIGQLLTLTRLENSALSADEKSGDAAYIDLEILVAHVAGKVDFEAQSCGGEVEIVASEACEIVGNGELLSSALENVIRNAILHGPTMPRVEISLRTEKKQGKRRAFIVVRDFGGGVPPDALEAMFRPFFRVAQARDRQSGGTGLGLSITQRAVEFHGGTVHARNAEGGGLEVEIVLPLESE